jgi:hypothetical protein
MEHTTAYTAFTPTDRLSGKIALKNNAAVDVV